MSARMKGCAPRFFSGARNAHRPFNAAAVSLALLVGVACSDNTTEPTNECSVVREINLGVLVEGVLSVGDCVLNEDQSLADYYRLTLTATTTIQIDMISEDFDSYVILNTSTQTFVDDDSGGGQHARLVRQLPAGTYEILANSFQPTGSGDYTILVAVSTQ